MKKLKKVLTAVRYAALVYAVAAAAAVTFLAVNFVADRLFGAPLSARAQAVCEALAGGRPVEASSGTAPAAAEAGPAALEGGGGAEGESELVLQELRREIRQAADEIQLLESSVVEQITRDMTSMNERSREEVDRVLAPFAELLNVALAGDDSWRRATGGQKLDAARLRTLLGAGLFKGDDGETYEVGAGSLRERIEALRRDLAEFKSSETRFRDRQARLAFLRSLPADVVAAGLSGGDGALDDREAVELLMALDSEDAVTVLKAVTEENSARTAALIRTLLEGGAEKEGIAPATAPPAGGLQ